MVVAVDGTLCDLTKTLAAGAASVTCLIPPGGDPHSYRLKPSDRSQIAKSDLVLHIGFGLTPSARKLKSPGMVVAVGEVALPSYGGSDPHVWHDPANSAAMVRVISRSLSPVLAASDRAALQQRTAKAVAVFQALQGWEAKQFSSLPSAQRVLVTDHRTYSHLANRFGLVEIAMLDSHTTGGVLRPSSLKRITQEVKASGAKTIFSPAATPEQNPEAHQQEPRDCRLRKHRSMGRALLPVAMLFRRRPSTSARSSRARAVPATPLEPML